MQVRVNELIDSVSPPLDAVADHVRAPLSPHHLARCEQTRQALNVSLPQREACAAAREQEPKGLAEETRPIARRVSAVVDAHVIALDGMATKLRRALRGKHSLSSDKIKGFHRRACHLWVALKVHRLDAIGCVLPSLTTGARV